jgi:hypothetical protein
MWLFQKDDKHKFGKKNLIKIKFGKEALYNENTTCYKIISNRWGGETNC